MKDGNPSLPLAIVLAGVVIAGAVIFSNRTGEPARPASNDSVSQEQTFRPIDETDHRLGSPNSEITLLEYSDLECPACQAFHPVVERLIEDYGKTGKLSWVYRHAPLVSLHSKAPKEAEASECASELGGNEIFWEYIKTIFKISPANNRLNLAELPKVAKNLGLDEEAFNQCLSSGRYTEKVNNDYADSLKAGLRGTPHNLLILKTPLSEAGAGTFLTKFAPAGIFLTADRKAAVIPGAYPYESMKQLIDLLLTL